MPRKPPFVKHRAPESARLLKQVKNRRTSPIYLKLPPSIPYFSIAYVSSLETFPRLAPAESKPNKVRTADPAAQPSSLRSPCLYRRPRLAGRHLSHLPAPLAVERAPLHPPAPRSRRRPPVFGRLNGCFTGYRMLLSVSTSFILLRLPHRSHYFNGYILAGAEKL